MKTDQLEVSHNGWTLKMALIVPLDQSAIDHIVAKTLLELEENRLRYKRYEDQLREEYSRRIINL